MLNNDVGFLVSMTAVAYSFMTLNAAKEERANHEKRRSGIGYHSEYPDYHDNAGNDVLLPTDEPYIKVPRGSKRKRKKYLESNDKKASSLRNTYCGY